MWASHAAQAQHLGLLTRLAGSRMLTMPLHDRRDGSDKADRAACDDQESDYLCCRVHSITPSNSHDMSGEGNVGSDGFEHLAGMNKAKPTFAFNFQA